MGVRNKDLSWWRGLAEAGMEVKAGSGERTSSIEYKGEVEWVGL